MRRAVIIPDIHFPLEDRAAVNCVLKAIRRIKPNLAICLGDVGEWESVSTYRYKRRKRPPLEYVLPEIDTEIEAVNKGLDQFDKALNGCEKYMLEGNHDARLNYFVDEYPYLSKYKFEHACNLKERGWQYYPYGKYLKVGKLYLYHGGHWTTMYHTKQHIEKLGKSVVYGHVHDIQRIQVSHMDGAHAAFSLGCLKDMSGQSNLWLKGRKTSWGHAFGIVDWFDDGNFRIDVVDIYRGKTFVWGEIIDGNT